MSRRLKKQSHLRKAGKALSLISAKVFKFAKNNPELLDSLIREIFDIIKSRWPGTPDSTPMPEMEQSRSESEVPTQSLKSMYYGMSMAPFPQWEELLDEFVNLLEEYNDPPRDVAYWYGERSLTGLLAAAAWRVPGGWSLEEFTSRRQVEKKEGVGRGDLWIGFGDSKALTVEAKVVWLGGSAVDASKIVLRQLDIAKDQLASLDSTYRVGRRTELCFVVPELGGSSESSRKDRCRALFEELPKFLEKFKITTGAFHYDSDAPTYGGRVYPGVMVAARFSRWTWFK